MPIAPSTPITAYRFVSRCVLRRSVRFLRRFVRFFRDACVDTCAARTLQKSALFYEPSIHALIEKLYEELCNYGVASYSF